MHTYDVNTRDVQTVADSIPHCRRQPVFRFCQVQAPTSPTKAENNQTGISTEYE